MGITKSPVVTFNDISGREIVLAFFPDTLDDCREACLEGSKLSEAVLLELVNLSHRRARRLCVGLVLQLHPGCNDMYRRVGLFGQGFGDAIWHSLGDLFDRNRDFFEESKQQTLVIV